MVTKSKVQTAHVPGVGNWSRGIQLDIGQSAKYEKVQNTFINSVV